MIQLYWKNATSKVVGEAHGVAPADLAGIDALIHQAHATVRSQAAAGRLGYADLPARREYRSQISALVQR